MRFKDCMMLKTFFISELIIEIDVNSFTGCNSLTDFSISENNEEFKTIDGVVFALSKKNSLSLSSWSTECYHFSEYGRVLSKDARSLRISSLRVEIR